jgi:hypothetical protein
MTGSDSRRCEPRRDPQALASNSLTLPVTSGDIPNAARAWLTQLLTALLNR